MRNKTWIPTAIVLGLSAMPVASMAGSASLQGAGVVSAGQLARAQSQAALLEAKLEIATLEAKIKKVRSGESDKTTPASPYANMGMPGGATPMPGAASVPQFMPQRSQKRRRTATPAPRVLSLMGAGSHYTATLALPDGAILPVHPGMNAGDGWKVVQVNSNGVLASHDGKVEQLAFSSQNGEQRGASGSFGVSGAPAHGVSPSMPSFTPPNMGAPMPFPVPGGVAPGTGLPGHGG